MKKTLYHSELVQRGPLSAKIVSGPHASKFQGKPNYIVLNLDGMDRQYTVENQACESALAPFIGSLVSFQAFGTRDAATIQVTSTQPAPQEQPAGGPQHAGGYQQPAPQYQPAPAPQPSPRPTQPIQPAPAPAPAPAPQQETQPSSDQKLAKIANLYIRSLQGAEYVRDWFEHHHDGPMPPELFQAATSSIFIEANRQGLSSAMPSGKLPS